MILIEIRYLNVTDTTAPPYLIHCALSVFIVHQNLPRMFRPIYIIQLCHHIFSKLLIYIMYRNMRDRGSAVVKVLCYKSESRWFDSKWCHWNF